MTGTLAMYIEPRVRSLVHIWLGLQVSHRGGTYSIEKLLALDEYTRSTSSWGVILMCVLTPIPMSALALSQELVPLQDPRDGWEANYGYWIRLAILCTVVANVLTVQARYLVEGVLLSPRQIAQISASQGAGALIMIMIFTMSLTFPLPFTIITMSVPYLMMFAVIFRIWVGEEVYRLMLSHPEQLLRLVAFIGMELTLLIVYPAYQTLFEAAANTNYELPVILLLPIIKLVMKYLVTLTVVHVEDMMPEAVIVTVDFFNALYLATSMQSASSIMTVGAIMAIDFSQTAVGLLALHRRTDNILVQLHEALGIPEDERHGVNLLSAVSLLCHRTGKFELQARVGVRVHSILQYQLSPESKALLTQLLQCPVRSGGSRHSRHRISGPSPSNIAHAQSPHTTNLHENITATKILSHRSLRWALKRIMGKCFCFNNTVSPSTSHLQQLASNPVVQVKSTQHRRASVTQITLLRESLEVLFTSECLVLAEFLEFTIPVFYGVYMMVVVHLPSAKYHVEMAGVTPENVGSTVQTVFVHGLLELASFVVLAIIMNRNCGIRALSHLAFVLFTQVALIQGKMVFWMVLTLGFRVVHFGTMQKAEVSLDWYLLCSITPALALLWVGVNAMESLVCKQKTN